MKGIFEAATRNVFGNHAFDSRFLVSIQIQPVNYHATRTQQVRAHGRASCPRNFCDQPGHKPPGNQTLRETAEFIESSGNRQTAAVGKHLQRILDNLVRTLINACPFPTGALLRFIVLILTQPSWADGDDGYTSATQLLLQGQRKCGQEGLSCGIDACKGNGLKACSRGDVDDALFPSLQHSRKEAVGELNDGLVVEAKHFELPQNREGAEFSAERATRTRLQWRSASARANAIPSPREAPVMRAKPSYFISVFAQGSAHRLRESCIEHAVPEPSCDAKALVDPTGAVVVQVIFLHPPKEREPGIRKMQRVMQPLFADVALYDTGEYDGRGIDGKQKADGRCNEKQRQNVFKLAADVPSIGRPHVMLPV